MIDEYTTCLPTNKPNTNPNSNSNSNLTNSTPTPTPSMSVITSASGGDAADQSPVVDPVDPVDLEIVFQQSVQPITNAGRTYYYLLSKCPMTWAAFMALVGHVTDRAGWAICRVCEHKWNRLSRLVAADGGPAFLGGVPSTYPESLQDAVRGFQRAVKLTVLSDQLHFTGDMGVCEQGMRAADKPRGGTAYKHIFLKTNLTAEPLDEKLNALLHTELPLVQQVIAAWKSETILTILSRYEARGEGAPGYKVNICGLRFMGKLLTELATVHTERTRQFVMMKHLMILFAGPRPDDALGGVHIFSSGSNLAACQDAVCERSFWKILLGRYNPVTYRQPTAPVTAGQVAAALKLVGGDTQCFEREHISIASKEAQNYNIWQHVPSAVPPAKDRTRISAADLLAGAVKSKSTKSTTAKDTCFDGASPSKESSLPKSSASVMNVDQFEAWLGELPPGAKLEYAIPRVVTPIDLGKPTTAKGREMVKSPVGWVIVPNGVNAEDYVTNRVYRSTYVGIRMITPHPGRWRADGSLSSRDHAVVEDGFVLVTDPPHRYNFQCSCLFAQFFSGDMHQLGRTRQTLHNELRIRRPTELATRDVFRGLLLSINKTSSGWRTSVASAFRATYQGETVCVTVQ